MSKKNIIGNKENESTIPEKSSAETMCVMRRYDAGSFPFDEEVPETTTNNCKHKS